MAVLNAYCWCNEAKKMRWAGHVARIAEKRNTYRILMGKPAERRPLGRPRCAWLIILIGILKKQNVNVWTELIWLGIQASGGLL
jgi:hypothetical protein